MTNEINYADHFTEIMSLAKGEVGLILTPDGHLKIAVAPDAEGKIAPDVAQNVILVLAAAMAMNDESVPMEPYIRKAATWFAQYGLRGPNDATH